MKKYILKSLFILLSFHVLAQSGLDKLRFKAIPMKSGLSSASIRCVFQDSRGFIWVGTQDGLNRYDGYTFKTFRAVENDPHSIQGSEINSIEEDSKGNLWIGTAEHGISIYDRQKDRFYSPKELSKGRVRQIIKDKKNNLWIVGDHIFYKVEAQNQALIKQKLLGSFLCATEGEKDELWLGTENDGIWVIDATTATLTRQYRHNASDSKSLCFNYIRALVYDAKNQWVWVSTFGGGLDKLNLKTGIFQHFAYNPKNLNTVRINECSHLLKTGDYIWVGTENGGLSIVNNLTNQFTHYLPEKNKNESINDISIWALYEDHQGRVWVGTFSSGLNVVDRYAQKFENVYIPIENKTVNAVIKDSQNRLWIGTEGGISLIETNKTSRAYQHNPQNPRSLGNNPVLALFEDSKKQIWAGTWAGGLSRFNEKTNDFTVYTLQKNSQTSLPDRNVFSLNQDQEGKLLVGTLNGVSRLEEPEKGIFTQYEASKEYTDTESRSIYKMLFDQAGKLWLGQYEGLYQLDLQSKKKIKFKDSGNVLKSHIVNTLFEDSKQKLWIGTANGLYEMVSQGNFRSYTTKQGLPNNAICGILEDSTGNLWISTNKGLSCFNPKKQIFRNYDQGDGTHGDYFKNNSCFKTKEGEFYFGGVNGLSRFYPNNIKDNPFKPAILFTDLKLFNRSLEIGDNDSILKKNIQETTEITLDDDQNVVTIGFIALNYTLSEKNSYAFKLDGFEKDWNEVGNKHEATYTSLPAGTYTFRVKAANNDGIWNEEGASLIIHVLPPFWETWWFRTALICFIATAIYLLYKARVKQIKAQNRKLEKLVAERTQEVVQKNTALQQQTEEILAQKDDILQKNTELEQQKEEIQTQRDAIILKSEEVNELFVSLKTLSIIGKKITTILNLEELIAAVYDKINVLVNASSFTIGIYDEKEQQLVFSGAIEEGKKLPLFAHSLSDESRFSVYCFKNRKTIFMNDVNNEYQLYIKQRSVSSSTNRANSMIYMPLELENKVVGVMSVQSYKKYAYEEQDLTILKNLASYISIALDNARNFTQLGEAKTLIEQKNHSITDSIRYALTIQQAILPNLKKIAQFIPNFFIFFRPKDIVSGDFYWFTHLEINKRKYSFVSVVDCTGHGVPGAFMSMIGFSILNELVNEKKIIEPDLILKQLDVHIRQALRQDEHANEDGMDLSIVRIERQTELVSMAAAGAKRDIYLFRNNKMQEIKGTKRSIGGFLTRHRDFLQTEIQIQEVSMVYLLSDGFSDQNNAMGEKYGSQNLINFLEKNAFLSCEEQNKLLSEEFMTFKGNTSQRDDVTIIGLKIE